MNWQETLRLYPAVGVLQRGTLEDYTIPGTNVTIPKGAEIGFNVAGMHCDPKYYPNPERFDPERFNKENKAKRHP